MSYASERHHPAVHIRARRLRRQVEQRAPRVPTEPLRRIRSEVHETATLLEGLCDAHSSPIELHDVNATRDALDRILSTRRHA